MDKKSKGESIMKIMSVNAGSSSLKFQLLEMPAEKLLISGVVEEIGTGREGKYTVKIDDDEFESKQVCKDHSQAVELMLNDLLSRKIINSYDEIEGVGHRVVSGGVNITKSTVITEEVKNTIRECIPLAPLHNPAHLTGIEAFEKALPNVFQIVVVDTAFHMTMAPDAYTYALPYEWYSKYQVRKYGAHGTSHQYVSQRCAEIMNKSIEDLKIITLHIGNGASISAVKGGKCVDTSMGLGPLAGIPMGTRCGTVDPTIVEYIMGIKEEESKKDPNVKPYDVHDVLRIFNKESGYKGFSGIDSDSRKVEGAAKEGNERAQLILDLQAKRICDYIGSYYVYMGGVDAIVFTAGIGENNGSFRKRVLDRLGVLGIEYNEDVINIRKKEIELSTPNSKVKVFVIPTNEELAIARDVVRLKKENNR